MLFPVKRLSLCALAVVLSIPAAGQEAAAPSAPPPAELTTRETGLLGHVGRWAAAVGAEWGRAELNPDGRLVMSGIHIPFGGLEVEISELLITGGPGRAEAVPRGLVEIRLDGERLAVPAFASAELVLEGEPASGGGRLRLSGLEAEVAPEAAIMQPRALQDGSGRHEVRWEMGGAVEDLEVWWSTGMGIRVKAGGISWTAKTGIEAATGESLVLQTDTSRVVALAGRVRQEADGTFRLGAQLRGIAGSTLDATGSGYDMTAESGSLAWSSTRDSGGVLLAGAAGAELANVAIEVKQHGARSLSLRITHLGEELQTLAGAGDTLSATVSGIQLDSLRWADGFPELQSLLGNPASFEFEIALHYKADLSGPTLAALLFGEEVTEWLPGLPTREWVEQVIDRMADAETQLVIPEMVQLTHLEAGVGGINAEADGHWMADPERISRLGVRIDGLRSFLDGLGADEGVVRTADVLEALARRLGTQPDALELELARSGAGWTINGVPVDRWLAALQRVHQIAVGASP